MPKRRLDDLFRHGDTEAPEKSSEGSPSKRPNLSASEYIDHKRDDNGTNADDPPISVPAAWFNGVATISDKNLPTRRKVFLPKQHNIRDHFSVFNALLSRVDILLEIVKYLPPRTIRNLYSISAPFHYQFNSHYGSFIMAATRIWAPQAETIFPWRCYSSLCIADPALRLPSFYRSRAAAPSTGSSGFRADPLPHIAPPHLQTTAKQEDDTQDPSRAHFGHGEACDRPVKVIPSLRWLTMVVFRTLVCREIPAYLTAAGFPVPPAPTVLALRKVWFLIDLQTNVHRIALIRNETFFTAQDLYHVLGFCVKLDMYFTDPVAFTGGERTAREYLLSERTLSTLWDFLRGADGANRLDLLRLWVKHGWTTAGRRRRGPFPEDRATQEAWDRAASHGDVTVLGLPLVECGRWGHELKGLGAQKLLRPDELVMREGVRRGVELQRYMWRMMRWGFLDRDLKAAREYTVEEIVPSFVLERQFAALRRADRDREKVEDEAFIDKARVDVD